MAKTHVNEPISQQKELSGNSRRGGDAPPEVQQKIIDIIIEEARKLKFNNRDIAYYIAIAKRESGFNPDAANSRSTASGIAQVVDLTAKEFGVNDTNRFDARASIKAGLGYFAKIKARLIKDYGSSSGAIEPMIHFLYHYGEYIHYNDRVRARDPKLLSELMTSERYKDSKTVVDEAIRIERILNDSHGLKIQLTDVVGTPMSNRKVFALLKKPKSSEDAKPSPFPKTTVAPSTSSTSLKSENSAQANDSPAEPTQVSTQEAAVQDAKKDGQEDVSSSTKASCDFTSQVPEEYELVLLEFTTDSEGNIPEIETDSPEPVVILIPRINYEEYNEALQKQLICEEGNKHTLEAHGEAEAHPAVSTAPPASEKKPSTLAPPQGGQAKSTSTPKNTSASTSILGAAEQDGKKKPTPPPNLNPTISFDDVIAAFRQKGWSNVVETSFAYIKQFRTKPKFNATPLDAKPTKKGEAPTHLINSSLPNKETKTAKVKDKVTTAEETASKKVAVESDAPWMNFAIQEQKNSVVEKSVDHLNDPEWKVLRVQYKEEDGAIKKVEKELRTEQKKNEAKQDKEKIKQLQQSIARHTDARNDFLKKMQKIEEDKNSPDIVKYHKATTLQQRSGVEGADGSSDNTPWCSSFTNWCLAQAGYKGTRDARAISWQNWGEQLSKPKYGAITVVKRGASSYHVGFFVGIVKFSKNDGFEEIEVKGKKVKKPKYKEVEHIKLLGGNQGSPGAVTESAGWTLDKLVTYRWPTEMEKRNDKKN